MARQRKIVGIWPAPASDASPAAQDEPLELGMDAIVREEGAADGAPQHAVDPRQWIEDKSADDRLLAAVPLAERQRPWLAAVLAVAGAIWIFSVAWIATADPANVARAQSVIQWIAIAAMPLALLLMLWMAIERGSHAATARHLRLLGALRDEQRLLDERLAMIDGHWQAAQASLRERSDHAGSAISASAQSIDEATSRLDVRVRETVQAAAQVVQQAEVAARHADGLVVALPKAEDVARRTAEMMQLATQTAYQQGSRIEEQLAAIAAETAGIERLAVSATAVVGARVEELRSVSDEADKAALAAAARFTSALDEQRVAALAMLADLAANIETASATIEARMAEARAAADQASSAQLSVLGKGLAAAHDEAGRLQGVLSRAAEGSHDLTLGLGEQLAGVEARLAAFTGDSEARLAAIGVAVQNAAADIDSLSGAGESGAALAEQTVARIEAARERFAELRGEVDAALPEALTGLDDAIDRVRSNAAHLPQAIQAGVSGTVTMLDRIREAEALLEAQARQLAALDAASRGTIGAQGEAIAEQRATIEALTARIAELSGAALPALSTALGAAQDEAGRSVAAVEESIAAAADRSGAAVQRIVGAAVEAAAGEATEERLARLAAVSAQAADAATEGAERLAGQLAGIDAVLQAAEARVSGFDAKLRQRDGESMARQMALMTEALQSASVDIAALLDREVSDQAWQAWLKGDRSVFARRTMRLLATADGREIQRRHGEDEAFRALVNRYIHDFEAMLRRLVDAPEGDALTVTLLSSDIGKIYVALAQAIERLRG